jgi:spermidine synthase
LFFSIASVPLWGTQISQRILIGVAAISAFAALGPILFERRKAAEGLAAMRGPALGVSVLLVITLIAAPLLGWTVSPGFWGAVAYGRFVATYQGTLMPDIIPESDVPQHDGTSNVYCTYTGEGLNGTVAVTVSTAGVRSFHSAGKVQASNDPHDMRLQRMLGHLSALAVKDPKSILVVACGAGVTAGTFLTNPSVEKITICDIEPLVPKYVTPMFTKENYGITDNVVNQNPRVIHTPTGDKTVTVVYDDGRHFIRTTKEKFDVITSDPIDPWVKGCAALNTIEYYTMCRDHLNPGGVMSLWIPFYESNDETAKSVLATFFQVYPKGILWSNDYTGDGYDAVLFGQPEGTKIDLDEWQTRLNSPAFATVKQSLAEAGFATLPDLMATYAGRAEDLQDWMKGAEINQDSNLRLQYLAGLSNNTYQGTAILRGILAHYKYPVDMFSGSDALKQSVRQAIETPRRLQASDLNAPTTVAVASP